MTTKIRLLHDTVGIPTGAVAVTQSASDNTTKVATTAYVTTALANLADSAPSTLNTLNELAAALGDDANFSTTVTNSIATKLPLAGGTLTGGIVIGGDSSINRGNQTSGELLIGGTTDGGFVDFDGTSLQLNTQRDPNTGTFINTGKSNARIEISGPSGGSHIAFRTIDSNNASASERMRIDKNGKVGIGQASPTTSLHVESSTVNQNTVLVKNTAGTGVNYGLEISAGTNATDHALQVLNAAGTSMLRVTGAGNVGIGTASPLQKLDVRNGNIMVGGYGGGTDYGMILTPADGSSYWHIYNDTSGELVFGRNITVGSSEKVRITSDGHVGIGMTPAEVGSDTVLSIYDSTSPRIKLHNSTSGTASGDGAEINTYNSDFIIENREAGNLRFFNNGSERIRISNNGNLEFKSTTGSFTGASSFTNHTNGVLYIRGGTSGLRLDDDSSINTIQIADGSSGYIKFETGNGTERWRFNSTGHFTPAQQHAYDIGGTNAEVRNVYAQGISFASNANTSGMSSEILDDYEEGTWTPDLRNHTTSFSTQTWAYGPQATYTKIGRMVFIHLSGRLSSVAGNGSGEFRIFGLPFTPHGTGGYQEYRMNFFLGNQPTATDSYSAFAFVRNGGSDFGTRLLGGGDNVFTANRIDSDTFFSIFGSYNTA